jgi:hypothetical protein
MLGRPARLPHPLAALPRNTARSRFTSGLRVYIARVPAKPGGLALATEAGRDLVSVTFARGR